jgi:TIR domain
MPHHAQFDVFLSHSSHDKPVVRALAERLKQNGLRVWFDQWEIGFGRLVLQQAEWWGKRISGLQWWRMRTVR